MITYRIKCTYINYVQYKIWIQKYLCTKYNEMKIEIENEYIFYNVFRTYRKTKFSFSIKYRSPIPAYINKKRVNIK